MNIAHPVRNSASLIALSAALATAAPAQAQEASPLLLGTVVLLGTGLPTEVRNNPASVSVVTEEEIEKLAPTSVARILSQVPGIRITENGDDRIQIRGETPTRVTILIDGQRVTDHTEYGAPILVSPESIERIEVVRGSSSVVSGNNAIGGVINIITKRGGDSPFEFSGRTGYHSATDGTSTSFTLGGTTGNFDYRFSFSDSDHGNLKTTLGELPLSDTQEREYSMFLGYRTGNHYFGFRAQDFDLSANVGTWDPANFRVSLPQRDLTKYSAFYEGTDLAPWLPKLTFSAFTQEIEREFLNDVTADVPTPPFPPFSTLNVVSTSGDLQETKGISGKAELALAPGHRTIVGVDYEEDSQIADKVSSSQFSFAPFPTVTLRYSDATIKTLSAFAQHEWAITNRLTATGGVRYYKVDSDRDTYLINGVPQGASSNDDERFLGAFGLVYQATDDLTLRANVSQGYTYPTLSQLYLETTAGGRGLTVGNPNLQPESSITYELGARLDRGNAVVDAVLFYTDAEDYIQRAQISTLPPPDGTYTYVNADRARSWGVELAAEFDSGVWGLRPYVNAGYLHREIAYNTGVTTTDTGTPRLTGTIGVRRDWTWNGIDGTWDLFLTGETENDLVNPDGTNVDPLGEPNFRDSWSTLNFRVNADLNETVSVVFEANNLLNQEWRPLEDYQGAERNFNIFLRASF